MQIQLLILCQQLEAMDSEIGRLLNSMTAEEKANTIIIFIGDNGSPNQVAQSPYSSQKAKGSLFQGGVNVPMFVSGYGVNRPGAREESLIHTTDFFTTISNIAGVSNTNIHNSSSFYDLLSATDTNSREYVYVESVKTME